VSGSVTINLYAGWIGLFLGSLSGIITGLFFHDEKWMGGYASWPRRMIRLGHISLFGLGLINLVFGLTVRALAIAPELAAWSRTGVSSVLLIVGAVTMPLVCYGSAWRKGLRHLFALPALAVTFGIGLFLWRIVSV